MPAVLLMLHSLWRWVVLVAGIAAVVMAFAGWLGRRPFTRSDHQLGQFYAMALDIQVLLGLLVWITRGWYVPLMSGAMANAQTRFFAFEHPFVMVFALGIAHMGRALSRKAAYGAVRGQPQVAPAGAASAAVAEARPNDPAAHRYAALLYLLSLAMILAFIPWDRLFR